MVNAFDILRSGIYEEDHSIKNSLQYDGEVWMDSGGFQFLRYGKIPDIEELARIYDQVWDARYFLNLDYPPSPTDSEHDLETKLRRSLDNYEHLIKKFDNVLPVLHYHWKTDIIMRYLLKYLNFNPKCIAIGGLVPYVLISRGAPKNSRRTALGFLLKIKRETDLCIHVLGLGSPVINPILSMINIDSTDTSTWRVKAAYGKVVMPGGGERHVSGRAINFGGKKATSDDLARLYEFLRSTGFPVLDRFDDIKLSFEYRALVNAWVVLNSFEKPGSGVFRNIYDEVTNELAKEVLERAY
ncbi:tRNA-ribosyltransferase [Vulcanisaeta souniana JCM 11219]|nr:tRNA-ribosyltransferase [Vulcanisaeta souniana JCM 11219]